MRNRNRSNILLMEILIAVLFFMLSATVLINVFATARNMTVRSGVASTALVEAQNVAESIYASSDPDEMLRSMDYLSSHGAWSKNYGDYTIYVVGQTRQTEAGELWEGEVRAFYRLRNPDVARDEDEPLFSLPCAKYKGV